MVFLFLFVFVVEFYDRARFFDLRLSAETRSDDNPKDAGVCGVTEDGRACFEDFSGLSEGVDSKGSVDGASVSVPLLVMEVALAEVAVAVAVALAVMVLVVVAMAVAMAVEPAPLWVAPSVGGVVLDTAVFLVATPPRPFFTVRA